MGRELRQSKAWIPCSAWHIPAVNKQETQANDCKNRTNALEVHKRKKSRMFPYLLLSLQTLEVQQGNNNIHSLIQQMKASYTQALKLQQRTNQIWYLPSGAYSSPGKQFLQMDGRAVTTLKFSLDKLMVAISKMGNTASPSAQNECVWLRNPSLYRLKVSTFPLNIQNRVKNTELTDANYFDSPESYI